MRKLLLVNILLIMTVTLYGQIDEDLIKKTITDSYVIGIHNGGTLDAISKGFHPGFELLGIGQDGNTMTKLPIYTWVENIRQAKEAGRVPTVKTECKFLDIDITGNAAMAKIELLREEKLIFTDYLFLYKLKDGWKIVNKIYFRH
jgi:hypothetical protein